MEHWLSYVELLELELEFENVRFKQFRGISGALHGCFAMPQQPLYSKCTQCAKILRTLMESPLGLVVTSVVKSSFAHLCLYLN